MQIDVIIPALNERQSIAQVVRAIPRPPVRDVIVVDNGSEDDTGAIARDAGAVVVREDRRGYGAACLRGIAALPRDCDVVVFLDADGSDDPALLPALVQPIVQKRADLVVGSRVAQAAPGSLTWPQRTGNLIASRWLTWRFGVPTTDLGPFRAIRRDCLERLGMRDPDYGWTVEMQIKALKQGMRYEEVSVPYVRSVGPSKISGTLRGVVGAGTKIIGWLMVHDFIPTASSKGGERA